MRKQLLDELLPTSLAVTFIPLIQIYIGFFWIAFASTESEISEMLQPMKLWIASIGPVLYLLMALFFIGCDMFDKMSLPSDRNSDNQG